MPSPGSDRADCCKGGERRPSGEAPREAAIIEPKEIVNGAATGMPTCGGRGSRGVVMMLDAQVRDPIEMAADTDMLILVDPADNEVGTLSKSSCHDGGGVLHRAFSLLIFNGRGELLLQQRAASKRLWPRYWSNSCCSHPRRSESIAVATARRLREELGLSCPLQFLYKFQYQVAYQAAGSENELCSVFIGATDQTPRIDHSEIAAWRWISPERLAEELSTQGVEKFTPWFRLEWERVWRDHREAVLALRHHVLK
jgi:isopentenyl-diphosphate delta-isomerase